MRYPLFLALAWMVSPIAPAAIIDYSYDDGFGSPDIQKEITGTGLFSFDTERRTMVSAQIDAELFTFDWKGDAAVSFDATPYYGDLWVEGYIEPNIFDGDNILDMFFGVFSIPSADADPMEHLDNADLWEERPGVMTPNTRYDFLGPLQKRSYAEVPEPTSYGLLLLSLLGLIGLTSRRQVS